jgi:hypothetical protein
MVAEGGTVGRTFPMEQGIKAELAAVASLVRGEPKERAICLTRLAAVAAGEPPGAVTEATAASVVAKAA